MKRKNLIFVILFFLILVFIAVVFVVFFNKTDKETEKRVINSVKVQKDGNTLTVNSNGVVTYKKGDSIFEDFWEKGKTDTFFDYINNKYKGKGTIVSGGKNYVSVSSSAGEYMYLLGDDELINIIEEETSGGGSVGGGGSSGGGSGGGGSGGSGGSGGGSGGGGSGDGSGGGSSGGSSGGPDPNCLYWRLSYCVRPRTPSPTPSSTPLPLEIREPDCQVNTQTGKTVIGNDLCLQTPSP